MGGTEGENPPTLSKIYLAYSHVLHFEHLWSHFVVLVRSDGHDMNS